MRRLRLLLPFVFCVPAFAAGIAEPVRPIFVESFHAAPTLPALALPAPALPVPSAFVAAAPPASAPVAAAPALAAIADRLPAANDSAPAPTAALTAAFDGAAAPSLNALEEETRALYSRYLPLLYRPLPVRYTYETSKLGGGGGHDFAPEKGHTIAVIPGEVDERGEVESAVGDRRKIRVQPKIEQLFASIHEFAHAVFDDAVGRNVGDRPVETAYDALTEGFAVKVEQLILSGMLRDADELGLSPRDAEDIRGILEIRREWLAQEDSSYAEGLPIWDQAYANGGEAGMLALLTALRAKPLMETLRSDARFQLSLGTPETARALLGSGGSAELRAGFEAAALAVAGRPMDPGQRAAAAAAIDAAGPAGWDWLIRRALSRQSNFSTPDGEMWIVPAFIRHGEDLAAPLFRLTALSRGLAMRTASFLAGASTRADGAGRIFEEKGTVARFAAVVAGAETLPWTPEQKKAWYAAIQRWISGERTP
ncbi:MAG: hypothetical protein ACHQ2Z_08880 [Elusimicrobiota bacterium]